MQNQIAKWQRIQDNARAEMHAASSHSEMVRAMNKEAQAAKTLSRLSSQGV